MGEGILKILAREWKEEECQREKKSIEGLEKNKEKEKTENETKVWER